METRGKFYRTLNEISFHTTDGTRIVSRTQNRDKSFNINKSLSIKLFYDYCVGVIYEECVFGQNGIMHTNLKY